MSILADRLRDLGVLRTLMATLVVALIAAAPFSGGAGGSTGWPLVLDVVAPTFFVTMVFVVPLDITMTLVFMSDKSGEARQRYRNVVIVESVLLAVLVLAWLPMVVRLLSE